jgi:hypothetical protein
VATTYDQIIQRLEVELEQEEKARERASLAAKTIFAKSSHEGRSALTEDEDRELTSAQQARQKADKNIAGIRAKLQRAREEQAEEQRVEASYEERRVDSATSSAVRPAYDKVARIGQEERTYNPGNGKQGGPFLRDVTRMFLYRDPEAEQRLTRHMSEERVERGQYLERAAGDAGTGAFTGLTVPQYLTEMYAPKVRPLRPFADACNEHPLPSEGMTINISQITTGSTTALQAAEFDTVSATSMDDTLLTENVQTAAGQQSLSRQAIERGRGIEDVTMNDLQRSLATTFDNTLINQATTGLDALSVQTLYDDTTPTGPEMYPKILGAMAGVEATFLGFAMPDIAVMHSRRWYWMQSQMASTWPMFGQPGISPQLAGENLATRYGSGVRGILPNGTVVIVDNNVLTTHGTNEDRIYVAASDECHLWVDSNAPQFIRAEQPKAHNLAVTLVLYMYFAYSFRRFGSGSVGRVGGTGLVAPTF